MNDVYVVHFEFHVAILPLIFIGLFLNSLATMCVAGLYFHRKRVLRNVTEPVSKVASCLLFFTWPLYLLLVLIKCLVGACADVWRKV